MNNIYIEFLPSWEKCARIIITYLLKAKEVKEGKGQCFWFLTMEPIKGFLS